MCSNKSTILDANSKDYVNSLERGLAVIRCFDKDRCQLSLTEVAKHTNLARATARRFLHTLHALGYVEIDGKLFRLSSKVLNLGFAYLSSQPLVDLIQPYIREVSDKTGESCSAAVLDMPDIVYIARSVTQQIMSVSLHVGTRLPILSTAMGRVLLASMSDDEVESFIKKTKINKYTKYTLTNYISILDEVIKVRKEGYAIVDQELEIGLCSVSVPILNRGGQVLAAINICSQPQKMDKKRLRSELIPYLKEAAGKISEVLPADERLAI
ncbi:MAG: IclR family transcriptional regulator C-terminal domain-containing protein [Pseudohongiellaceae bacterium]